MNVEFRKSFEKDLSKIRDPELLQRIQSAIEEIETIDNLLDLTNIKKLTAAGDYYRIRIGDYRIGLSIDEDTIFFDRVKFECRSHPQTRLSDTSNLRNPQ